MFGANKNLKIAHTNFLKGGYIATPKEVVFVMNSKKRELDAKYNEIKTSISSSLTVYTENDINIRKMQLRQIYQAAFEGATAIDKAYRTSARYDAWQGSVLHRNYGSSLDYMESYTKETFPIPDSQVEKLEKRLFGNDPEINRINSLMSQQYQQIQQNTSIVHQSIYKMEYEYLLSLRLACCANEQRKLGMSVMECAECMKCLWQPPHVYGLDETSNSAFARVRAKYGNDAYGAICYVCRLPTVVLFGEEYSLCEDCGWLTTHPKPRVVVDPVYPYPDIPHCWGYLASGGVTVLSDYEVSKWLGQ